MYGVITFSILLVVLYAVRLWLHGVFKRHAAYQAPPKENLFEANPMLVHTDMLFIFLLFTGGILSQFVVDIYDKEHALLSNISTFVFIGAILISAAVVLPVLQHNSSYFNWGTDQIEYNIAFQNKLKDTTKIALEDISGVTEDETHFSLHLINGECLLLKKRTLEFLNGYSELFDNLRSLQKKL